jgi:hypothetical protein
VFRSSDGDATFMAPVNGAMNFPAGHLLDEPWLAVDNFAGPGQGNLYLAFTDVEDDICFTRSTDGGATWAPTPATGWPRPARGIPSPPGARFSSFSRRAPERVGVIA